MLAYSIALIRPFQLTEALRMRTSLTGGDCAALDRIRQIIDTPHERQQALLKMPVVIN